jgi:inhibitor of cysteine peptidase
MRPRAKVALLVAITLGGILPISIYFTAHEAHGMVRFNSYSDLEHFLLTRTSCNLAYDRSSNFGGQPRAGAAFPAAWTSTADTSVSTTPSHSETNNQVAGVDELDKVKSDGQYIYAVTNNTVVMVGAYPVSDARFLSRISLTNQSIDGIFVDGSRLVVVSEAPRYSYSDSFYCGSGTMPAYFSPFLGCTCSWTPPVQTTSISVYDLTNRSNPTLLNTVTINGTFVGARLIGDVAYLVATAPARFNQSLPVTVLNRQVIPTQATQIYHSDISDAAFSYTTVLSLNVNQSNAPTVETYLLGTSSTIYVSLTNIFLTQPVWESRQETVIHRIAISGTNISYESTGTVPGHVLNQYSMDEYNGSFRVATSSPYSGDTSLYVLDESLRVVGRLEGISPGETFHAARFMGEKAYLVTFKRTDPLFVISLAQPANPLVLGQLNVTGVSDYLQPYDSNHLIGIGKSAQDVAWENAAIFLGLKISLFDVTNPDSPSDTSDFTIGDRGTDSPALTDAKALLFDRSLNLLVLPIEVYARSSLSGYSGPVSQAAYVFQVTLQNGLVLMGTITHLPSSSPSGLYSSPYFVTRALYIGNVLYTVSNAMIRMNNLTDLSDLGSVSLA